MCAWFTLWWALFQWFMLAKSKYIRKLDQGQHSIPQNKQMAAQLPYLHNKNSVVYADMLPPASMLTKCFAGWTLTPGGTVAVGFKAEMGLTLEQCLVS